MAFTATCNMANNLGACYFTAIAKPLSLDKKSSMCMQYGPICNIVKCMHGCMLHFKYMEIARYLHSCAIMQ